jgi:hypothetical protein
VPLFGSSGFRRFTALRLRQVFYAPPPRHSLIAIFLSGVPARSRLSLLRLIILLFIFCFLWFTYILFPLFIFCFAGFPCICFSIFLYCFFCLFVLCVFYFYSSTDLLYVCFAVLHPLSGLFPRPHRIKLLTRPSVYGVYLHVISFISLYFFIVLLVISLVSISRLWGVMLDPDLWVVDVNIILAFGSRRTSVGLRFLALSVKK